jgi:hypothetical protein
MTALAVRSRAHTDRCPKSRPSPLPSATRGTPPTRYADAPPQPAASAPPTKVVPAAVDAPTNVAMLRRHDRLQLAIFHGSHWPPAGPSPPD